MKLNRELMQLMDAQYLLKPYYGVYRMWELADQQDQHQTGAVAQSTHGTQKPNTSKAAPDKTIYPYLPIPRRPNGAPEILNTNKRSQITSKVFNGAALKDDHSTLSMDEKGGAIDNVFSERLWGSVKYEYIYLNPPLDGHELQKRLEAVPLGGQHYSPTPVNHGHSFSNGLPCTRMTAPEGCLNKPDFLK